MKIFLSALLLLCMSFNAYCTNSTILKIDKSQPYFKIALSANPTTGYQWTVKKFNKQLFKLVSREYQSTQVKRIGSGGKTIFTFKLQAGKNYPEKTELVFAYVRPWEKKEATVKKVSVVFIQKNKRNSKSL